MYSKILADHSDTCTILCGKHWTEMSPISRTNILWHHYSIPSVGGKNPRQQGRCVFRGSVFRQYGSCWYGSVSWMIFQCELLLKTKKHRNVSIVDDSESWLLTPVASTLLQLSGSAVSFCCPLFGWSSCLTVLFTSA